MWRKLPSLSNNDLSEMRGLRRAKLYADEDIEEDVVQYLRDEGINIQSAREVGLRGKPDSFHAAYAFRKKRFILTKNGRHYLNDRKLPWHRTYGVIVLEGDFGNLDSYSKAIHRVIDIAGFGEIYEHSKIRVSPDEFVARYIDHSGKITTQRFKHIRGEFYEWID